MPHAPRPFPLLAVLGLALGIPLLPGARPAAAAEGLTFEYTEHGYVRLDPLAARTANDERIILALWEGLTVWDPATGRAAPGVAASWEVAPDGLSWTFRLRPDAVWSDGKPVRAQDFSFAWKRMVDPLNEAGMAAFFRPIEGVGALLDAHAALAALDELSKGLKDLAGAHPKGIPGDELAALVEASGARRYVARIENKDLRRLLKWGSELFPAEKATEVREAVRAERRKHKEVLEGVLETFGTTTGVVAKDDRTLWVRTQGWRPYLPDLVARAAYVPQREDVLSAERDMAFEPAKFVGNGPYVLKGRGARPRPGVDRSDSVVHLVRNAAYRGPAAGVADQIFCWTDLGPADDQRRFESKKTQWFANPSREARKALEKNPAFRTRPAQSTMYLVVRCDKPPFDRLDARRAFALALDRAALARLTWPAAEPAERLVPPGVRGASPGVKAPGGGAAAAKEALKAVGIKPDDFPWIEVFHYDEDDASAVAGEVSETWKRVLGIESSGHVSTGGEWAALRSGKFAFALEEWVGDWNDPSTYVEHFHSRNPDSMTGWTDEAFDLLVDGLSDPAALAAGQDKVLAVARDAATLKARLQAVAGGGESAREALRQALLVEAEQRLLDQFVVIPVAFPRRGELLQGVTGLGSDEAWKNPAFPGSLRSAKPGS